MSNCFESCDQCFKTNYSSLRILNEPQAGVQKIILVIKKQSVAKFSVHRMKADIVDSEMT